MTVIVSPPEIVEQAQGAGLEASLDIIFDFDFEEPEGADEASRQAIEELHDYFPHLDNATLILFCDYIRGVAIGYTERYGTLAAGPLVSVGQAYRHIIVDLANDLLDDIADEQLAAADEALGALRTKLRGEDQAA